MNDLKYTIQLDLKGGVLSELKSVSRQLDKVKQATNGATDSLKKMLKSFTEFDGQVIKGGIDAVREMTSGLADLSRSGMDFGQSLADLSAITGLVGKDLEAISAVARETGKSSGLGAKGAVDAFTLLASQIQVDKIGMEGLMQLQKETITLAQAGGIEMTEAATAMAATINQFGLQATEANRVINVLAAGSKYGAAEVADLAQSFKVSGATAAAAGLSVEQTAGALEVLSQSNLKGAEAGTALRNIILKLQTTLGMDLSKVGLASALEALAPKLQDTTYLAKVFGAENIAAAQYLITNAQAVREMTEAVTGTGVAQEQAAIRTDTMMEKMKRFQAQIADIQITLFEATGGLTGYAAAAGDSLVMVSQLIPLFSLLGKGVGKAVSMAGGLAVVMGGSLLKGIRSVTTQLPAMLMNLQFVAGVFLTLPGRIMTFVKALTAQRIATVLLTAKQWLLNVALTANPIGLLVAAVAGLVAVLTTLYLKFDTVREKVNQAWESLKRFFGFAKQDVKSTVTVDITKIDTSRLKDAKGQVEELQQAFDPDRMWQSMGLPAKQLLIQQKAKAVQPTVKPNLVGGKEGQLALNTLGGLQQKIRELQEAQRSASLENAINLQREIELYRQKAEAMELAIKKGANGHLSDDKYKEAITAPAIEGLEVPAVQVPVKFEVSEGQGNEIQRLMKGMVPKMDFTSQITEGIQSIASVMGNLSGVLNESAGAWLNWGASVLQSIAQVIPQIVALTNKQVTSALTQMTANTGVAATGAAASSASVPIVGPILAAAAVASMLAMLASIPKPRAMAAGGIASGPTLALVGEYPGARNNPEVIAPLDKLQAMIQPATPSWEGLYLETKLRGKDLYVALRSVEHGMKRTR